jgi:hypothetical protein
MLKCGSRERVANRDCGVRHESREMAEAAE